MRSATQRRGKQRAEPAPDTQVPDAASGSPARADATASGTQELPPVPPPAASRGAQDRLVEPFQEHIRGLEMPWNRALQQDGPVGTAARALGPWSPQEFTAECVEVIAEGGNMKTFVFRRTDGAPLAFRPGQYLNISVPVYGREAEPLDRSYSLSSAPTQPWTFAITVKRDPAGQVSPWLHQYLHPGMIVEMLGPVGAFHLPDSDRRARYLLLAAGAGITPMMSMIRTIHSLPGRADVVLLYHGKGPGDYAFTEELEHLARVDERFTVHWSIGSRGAPSDWAWLKGRLSLEMINSVAPDANGRQVYVCGPAGYLDAAKDLVNAAGVDDTSLFMEYFTDTFVTRQEYQAEVAAAADLAEAWAEENPIQASAAVAEPATGVLPIIQLAADGVTGVVGAPGVADEAERDVTPSAPGDGNDSGVDPVPSASQSAVGATETGDPSSSGAGSSDFPTVGEGALTMTFLGTKIKVRIDPDQKVLDAARTAGVRIGANCQEGMCGSCKSVKLSGEVEMNHQGGIRQREIDAGKFLPCCSTATTDLVIDA
jgi:ferredoxin-NADP reductase/ferredoxin